MALDIIPKQEGGKLKAVASGTLPSGVPVVVNADGTVSEAGLETVSTAFGSPVVFEASFNTAHISSAYDPVANKVVVFYEDRANSDKGTYIVGTVSGSSISFGTAALFENASSSNISSVYDPVSGNIVVIYRDEGNSNYGTAIVGTVSGTSISFGSPVVFSSSDTLSNGVTYDTTSNKVVIGYTNQGNSGYGTAIVGTVSGTSISFGTAVVFSNSSTSTNISVVYDSAADKSVFAYTDNNDPYTGLGTSIVGTVSGTSISFGSEVVFDSAGAANHVSAAYDASNGKVVICYSDTGDSSKGKAIVGTVSGTSISYGVAVTYSSGITGPQKIVYSPNVGRVTIFFRDHDNSLYRSAIVGTVSGTTISFDAKNTFGTSRSDYFAPVYDSGAGKVVLSYEDQDNSYYGTSLVMTVGGDIPNLTSENYIGMSGGVVKDLPVDQAIGTPVVFEAAGTSDVYATFDSSNNKVIMAYLRTYGWVSVGTVSETSISFGTPVAFASSAAQSISAAFDTGSNKVVIAYKDGGNSNYGTAIVGTVSGTSISFGSPVVFESATTDNTAVGFDSTNNKVVISYRDQGNSFYGTAIVGTVSGTAISFGSPVVFNSGNATAQSISFDSNSGKVVIAYATSSNGSAIVGTVSGTAISFGSASVFESAAVEAISNVFDSSNNKVVISYQDQGNGNYGTATVGTVSSTSISFGTPVVFEAAATNYISSVFDSNINKVVIAYEDDANNDYGTLISGTVSGTSISFGSSAIFENASVDYVSATFDSNSNKVVVGYIDNGNFSYGTGVVIQASGSYLARGSVADGDNATVDIVGTVSTNQVGLTAGQQYYVQTDGTIGETPASPSVLAGTAVSATKLLVKT